jgi:trehalose synthase
MFGSVTTNPRALHDYRAIIGDDAVEEILELADSVKGARVIHINATAFGGGVAEILATMVPLMNDVGLKADWQVIRGAAEFYNVTKAMHNSLQGAPIEWTSEMFDTWIRYNQLNADLWDEGYDFVVIHDPQPAGMLRFVEQKEGRRPPGHWIWRCHIDLTEAQPGVWDFLRHYVEPYDASIWTMRNYAKDGAPNVHVIAPAIDPLSPKNMELSEESLRPIIAGSGIDPDRPFICQLARFDPWKDPLGVIDAYRIVKEEVPDLQLVLIGSMASDDPEGMSYYERAVRRAGEDYDIHFLVNLGNVEANSFQRSARVMLQKSIREGFGLTVSEASWKGRPIIGGNAGGIPMQIVDGKTGYLVNSVEECADRVLTLLHDPDLAEEMGRAGREHVRRNFLITRNFRDYLRLFNELNANGSHRAAEVPAPRAKEHRSVAN